METNKLDFSQISYHKNIPYETLNSNGKEFQQIHFMNKLFMRFNQRVHIVLNFFINELFLAQYNN